MRFVNRYIQREIAPVFRTDLGKTDGDDVGARLEVVTRRQCFEKRSSPRATSPRRERLIHDDVSRRSANEAPRIVIVGV